MINAFTKEEKRLIEDYIKIQPIKVVEAINTDKKTITYSKDLKGKTISILPGDEEITRAFILTRLVNELGYSIDKIEIEHEYTAGRPHTNTSIIDIIVRDKNNDAFLFIETKSPEEYATMDKDLTIEEQLFKVAGMERTEGHKVRYLVLYTLDINNNVITDDCMIIDSNDFPIFNNWKTNRDYLTEIPEGYGEARKIPYVKGSSKDLVTNFSH
ncbi:type I restriction enzyme HsdR N-terminal domain-containing protein, partial [Enterocloster citroniae]